MLIPKTVQNIIDILENSYHINITPSLNSKIQDLYNLGKIQNEGDFEKILFALYNYQNIFFENEEIFKLTKNVLENIDNDNINILIFSSDIGSSLFSFVIECELILKNLKRRKNVNYFTVYPSFFIVERIKNNRIEYQQLIKASDAQLKYFIDMIENYILRNDILNRVNFVVTNPFNNSLRSENFDIIIVNNFSKIFLKEKLSNFSKEMYRLLKNGSYLICDFKETNIFSSGIFEQLNYEGYFYFKKPYSDEFIVSDYTFEDALNFFREKKYNESLGILQALLGKEEGNNIEILKLMLLIYTRLNDILKIEFLEKQLEINDIKDPDFDFILGTFYFNKLNYSISKLYFQKTLSSNQNNIYSLYYLALINKMEGKKKSSVENFKKIVKLVDENNFYIPRIYANDISMEMIKYIAESEIEGEEK
ncbi:MAG: methyltransferase domain-containing protein [candidate division WOR-3 bacterium]